MAAVLSPSTQPINSNSPASSDAIELLIADHDKAKALFEQYSKLQANASAEEKFEIAKLVCGDLLIHMALEEALFYPPVRKAIKEKDLVKEGEEEHGEAKELIRALGNIDPGSPEFDEKMQELSKAVSHHVEEEENEMFPKVRQSSLDLESLGRQMIETKNATRVSLGLPAEG